MNIPEDIALPCEAEIFNKVGARMGPALAAVVRQFDVDNAARYQPRDLDGDGHNETMCNVFLSDVTTALCCPIPRGDASKWLRANDQIDWLHSDAAMLAGWREVGAPAAVARAFIGFPTVATYKAPHGPGHVAIVMPTAQGIHVAQAGAVCSSSILLAKAFGQLPVVFFSHA